MRPGERPYLIDFCGEATGSIYKLSHWYPKDRQACSKLSDEVQGYLLVNNLPTVRTVEEIPHTDVVTWG